MTVSDPSTSLSPTQRSAPGSAAPHLGPGLAALVVAVALLVGVQALVGARLPGSLPFYAAYAMSFKVNGNVLQSLAFRTPHELPVYGSSELDRWTANRADAFFRLRPTGFAVFPVGRGGATCLLIQQKLAAIGDDARGKSVVIFLSPGWFLASSVDERAVAANLSTAQLGAWIFGDALSPALKTDLARRLRDHAGFLEDQSLLAEAVRCLAEPTGANRARLALLSPLGKLQNALLRRFDYGVLLWEIVFPQQRWHPLDGYDQNAWPATGRPIDWERLFADAEADPGPPPGHPAPGGTTGGGHDREFVARLNASAEFGDLSLLLHVLRELRMRVLFISQPFNGPDSDAKGITPRARRVYYERVEALVRAGGYPLRDFSAHEADPLFFSDAEHPSAKAWLYYDREIDRFYAGSQGGAAESF